MRCPVLYIFAGLPGAGKSTLARLVARERHAVYLRIDTVEQALRDELVAMNGPEGYVVAYRIAKDNLGVGMPVVADSVNPVGATRQAWRDIALQAAARCVEIEVICSNRVEHRRRIESRSSEIAGLRLPTWDEVQRREYEAWETEPVVIDTAGATPLESLGVLQRHLESVA